MDYQKVLTGAEEEIAQLLADRQRIDARLYVLKAMVQNCRLLLGTPPARQPISVNIPDLERLINETSSDPGITDAIRRSLGNATLPLSAPEIKSSIEELGFDLSNYVNAGAVIHNTLTRLVRQGDVMRIGEKDGKMVYALVKNDRNKAFYGE